MTTPDTFAHIPLAHIVASRTNPRKHFNPVKLHELAESIRASGMCAKVSGVVMQSSTRAHARR